jgi:hypothetical protein
MRFKELHTSVLLESAKDRYLAMFTEPVFLEDNGQKKAEVTAMVQWAISNLKKEDWVVWFLRKFKVYYWYTKGDKAELLKSKWFTTFKHKAGYDAGYDPHFDIQHFEFNTPALARQMKHWLDMSAHIPKMRDVVFGWQEWADIEAKFEEIEKEFLGDIDEDDKVVDEYGVKVLDFGDGFAWYDLEKGGCSKESAAMGHCGNGYDRAADNETILSLRKRMKSGHPKFDGKLTPTLTFILHKGGKLGEMKGRGNEKPAERYHKYIVPLLKLDIVTQISGGGYKPENNFSLADLSDTEQKELYASKPGLFDLTTIYKMEGPTDKFADAIKTKVKPLVLHTTQYGADNKQTKSSERIPSYGDEGVLLGVDVGVDTLAERLNLDNLKSYADTILNGYIDGDMHVEDDNSKLADAIFDCLKHESMHYQNAAKRVLAYLSSEYAEIIEDNEYDMTDVGDVGSLLDDAQDDTMETIHRRADSSAQEYGAVAEVEEAYEKMLNKNGIRQQYHDGEWHIYVDLKTFGDAMVEIKDDGYNDVDDETMNVAVLDHLAESGHFEDLDVPYYGFSGYDDVVYLERIVELVSEDEDGVFDIEVDDNA